MQEPLRQFSDDGLSAWACQFTFDGNEVIDVMVVEPTTSIKVHCKEIAISNVSFTGSDGKEAEVVAINFNLKLVTVEFVFAEALQVGKGSLSIAFVGQLNNKMAGFYRSSYKDIKGNTQVSRAVFTPACGAKIDALIVF